MLLTKEKIYAILHFLLSIKQSYVGSLSRYDTSVLSHSKKWLEKYTVTHLTLLYLPITEGQKKRFCFQENKISCPRHKEFWLQSTDKNVRNFIFFREQGSSTHV